jgi:hypothetical protein
MYENSNVAKIFNLDFLVERSLELYIRVVPVGPLSDHLRSR